MRGPLGLLARALEHAAKLPDRAGTNAEPHVGEDYAITCLCPPDHAAAGRPACPLRKMKTVRSHAHRAWRDAPSCSRLRPSGLQTGGERFERLVWASGRKSPEGSAAAARCGGSLGRWVDRHRRSVARSCATAGQNSIERPAPIRRRGTGPCVRSDASWLAGPPWPGQYLASCDGNGRPSRSPAGSTSFAEA